MKVWMVPFSGSQVSIVKPALHTKADVNVLLCQVSACVLNLGGAKFNISNHKIGK